MVVDEQVDVLFPLRVGLHERLPGKIEPQPEFERTGSKLHDLEPKSLYNEHEILSTRTEENRTNDTTQHDNEAAIQRQMIHKETKPGIPQQS